MAKIYMAGAFATSGERQVAQELETLPNNWIVICNKTLVANNGRSSHEIDLIVIGNKWIFLLDVKSWHGRIRGDEMQWVRQDGSADRSPLRKIDYLAKIMAGHLRTRVADLYAEEAHFVRGGIVFSALTQLPTIIDPLAKENVYLLPQLCERLLKLDQQTGSPLVKQNRHLIQKALFDLSNRSAVPQEINEAYRIEESIDLRPGVRLWRAIFIDSNEPRDLMVYDLSLDPLHRDEQRQFYLREFKALKTLSETGLVPDISDHFIWSEDFLIVPIKPLSGKALSAFIKPRTRDELIKELQVAAEAFRGLATIHQKGIVHRALSPDVVHVINENHVMRVAFTNFYAARMTSATERSIASSLDIWTNDDPYAAPEIAYGYEFSQAASDVFSLGIIFLERWSQDTMSQLRLVPDKPAFIPALQDQWSSFPLDVMQELTSCLDSLCGKEQPEERPQAAEAAQLLRDLARRLKIEVTIEDGKKLDGRYIVSRKLGQGSMARTYLAVDEISDETFALKQFLNPSSSVAEQAKNEFKALCKLHHPNLPRVYDVFPLTNDVHIKMGYIPGPTLQEVENELPWQIDKWWSFTQGLMSAVEELERHGLLHRDIKPSNIILHQDDQHPVLIDFGFATPIDMEKSLAGTPLYLPPEAFAASKPPESSDRYATAVVLFKTLTGHLPFVEPQSVSERNLHIPADIVQPTKRKLAEVLLQALARDPEERFKSIVSVRERLQEVFLAPELPAHAPEQRITLHINPWVNKLRSLYRNSRLGNGNNRGLDDDFVRATYVETKLDHDLLPLLFQHKPHVIFLSGNPGDGKTAFLERVRTDMRKRGGTEIASDESGWEWQFQGHRFRSCYDASESNQHQGQSADEQLSQKLVGLEGDQQPDYPVTVLVAINDGRLIDFFSRNHQRFGWLNQQLSRKELHVHEQLVWLIDLKQRAFVTLPGSEKLSIFQEIVESLLEIDNWQDCKGCSARHICPIRQNVQKLNQATITERLERLFLLTHLRRQQHITMRDLRSAIAYITTGDLGCVDVHQMYQHENESGLANLANYDYWQLIFSAQENQILDPLFSDFVTFDPGLFAHPRLDRVLHFHQEEEQQGKRRQLFRNKVDLARRRFVDETAWMVAFKRRLYFEMSKEIDNLPGLSNLRWEQMLPYQYADLFFDALHEKVDQEKLKEQLAFGLLRSHEGVVGVITTGQLSITVEASEEYQLIVLKQIPLTEFRIVVEQPQRADLVETVPDTLIFEHHKGTPRLEITLDLFELLMQVVSGLQPGAPEYVPLLEDLKMFKSALLMQETHDLVLVENKQRIHYVTQQQGNIVRTDSPLR